MSRLACSVVLALFTFATHAASAGGSAVEHVASWHGDLRVIAVEPETRVRVLDADTGRDAFPPVVLARAGDSLERTSEVARRVRIHASQAGGGPGAVPIVVWTGRLSSELRHPVGSPEAREAWMSYLPPLHPREPAGRIGKSFLGFTSRELYLFARVGDEATRVVVEDLATNVDDDTDDTQVVTPDLRAPVHADGEVEVYFLDEFEDDTVRITSNVELAVLAGVGSRVTDDWAASPPAWSRHRSSTLAHAFVHGALWVHAVEPGTTVTIDDLSGDADPLQAVLPDSAGRLSLMLDGFERELVRVSSDRPVVLHAGPASVEGRSFAHAMQSIAVERGLHVGHVLGRSDVESLRRVLGAPRDAVAGARLSPVDEVLDRQGRVRPGSIGAARIEAASPFTVVADADAGAVRGAFVPAALSSSNQPPIAVAAAAPPVACPQATVVLDGTGSFDQDSVDGGHAESWEWDADIAVDADGDGDPANDRDAVGEVALVSHSDVGPHVARLTYVDDDGTAAAADVTVTIEDHAPPAIVACPSDVAVPCDGQGNPDDRAAWIQAFQAVDACSDVTVLTEPVDPHWLTFDDFCDLSALRLNGSADTINRTPVVHDGRCVLRLTEGTRQSGSAFLRQTIDLSGDASFSTHFTFQITDPTGLRDIDGRGADGIVFVVQTVDDTTGRVGRGIGYEELDHSVGIEFDTWDNGPRDALNGNHVGINLNGSTESDPLVPVSPRFNDGSVWHAWIDHDGVADRLEVRVSQSPVRPAAPTASKTVDLVAVLGQSHAHLGFTSGTGGASGDHDILSWSLGDGPASGGGGETCGGETTETLRFIAVDASGNQASCISTFSTRDDEPPELTAGPVAPCHRTLAEAEQAVLASAHASDACSEPLELEVDSDGTCDARVTVTARDACGNEATLVRWTSVDTAPPVLVGVPADRQVSCDRVPPPASPSVADSCDPSPALDLVEHWEGDDCEGRVLVRTWTAVDRCGNSVSATQRITVADDGAPRFVEVPMDLTVSCDEIPPVVAPVVVDTCDPAPTVRYEEVRRDGICPDAHVLERRWTATDRCGHSAVATQRITVVDDRPPALVGVPADVTVSCVGVPLAAPVTATDACDPAPTVSFSEVRLDGGCDDHHVLERTWTARDRCGNVASATQRVLIVDGAAPTPQLGLEPVDSLPPLAASAADSACSRPARRLLRVSCGATDDCDPAPAVSARFVTTHHDLVDRDGSCVTRTDSVPVACGEVVEVRLLAAPCPSRSPRSPRPSLAVRSDGVRVVMGERVQLEVTAVDRCGNVAFRRLDPATTSEPGCGSSVRADPCCALMAPPASRCDPPACADR